MGSTVIGRGPRCDADSRKSLHAWGNSGLSVVPISIERMVDMTDRPVPAQALLAAAVVEMRSGCADDGERIDRIGFLERAKSVLGGGAGAADGRLRDLATTGAGVSGCAGAAAWVGDRGSARLRDQVFAGVGITLAGGCPGVGDGDARHARSAGRRAGVGAGCAGGGHRDTVSDPGGPWPGGRRVGAGGGVDVGPGDQPGGAAAGDRTRPGRRRLPGSTGSGGPVRVHPTATRHHGQDHRGAAGGTGRRAVRVSSAPRKRRKRPGTSAPKPRSTRTPSSNGSPARPPPPRSRWRSSW